MTSRNVLDFAIFILYTCVAYSLNGVSAYLFAFCAILAFAVFAIRLKQQFEKKEERQNDHL